MGASDALAFLDVEDSDSLWSECLDLFEPTEEFDVGEESEEEVLPKSKVAGHNSYSWQIYSSR